MPGTVVDHIDGMTIRDYWESKKRFGNGSIQEVHWGAVGKAMDQQNGHVVIGWLNRHLVFVQQGK